MSGLISSASEALSLDPDMNPWVLLAEEEREEVGGGWLVTSALVKAPEDLRKE